MPTPMGKPWQQGLILLLMLTLLGACSQGPLKGRLHIQAPSAGTYEIYSMAGEATLQFVSEQVGHFNEDLLLAPGNYLILADCSHRTVTIHAGEKQVLAAYLVQFLPPQPPQEEDLFSIQCSRYDKSHLKQQFTNRFSFHMVSGVKDLLVGMLPFKIAFPAPSKQTASSPQTFSYQLSALRIAPWQGPETSFSPYFISPSHDLLSITQAQEFGKWQFLLPGTYKVYVNGTEQTVSLQANESHTISPAGLRVKTLASMELEGFAQMRDNPFTIELNHQHALNLNTFYPVLPGTATIRLNGSNRYQQVQLEANQLSELSLKSVLVDAGCAPGEWECLGKREVNLYYPEQHYPFQESISDIPIFYFEPLVEVGLESSKGIRFRLPTEANEAVLKIGKVQITALPTFKPGHFTDLLRLETQGGDYIGHSHDILAGQSTMMTLIAGNYLLARYTNINADSERIAYKVAVRVLPGETSYVEIPYYLPEAKARLLAKQLQQQKRQDELRQASLRKKLRPVKVF